ncbi:hypothetical protein Golax_021758 [Gossypium laxum]|uniref:NADH dehydrogenase [ubiquinone] 1 alpha subcomplex subunit 13 n=1 Tax=Gossypium laxum TaxID=34288 RepID=A0A7J9AMC9_9ROSI|nr:hypothetical protein [Gossypium laxum]
MEILEGAWNHFDISEDGLANKSDLDRKKTSFMMLNPQTLQYKIPFTVLLFYIHSLSHNLVFNIETKLNRYAKCKFIFFILERRPEIFAFCRALKEEKFAARRAVLPVLQAEEDERFVKEWKKYLEYEAEVMKDVPGWKVGENVYNSGRWMPPATGELRPEVW